MVDLKQGEVEHLAGFFSGKLADWWAPWSHCFDRLSPFAFAKGMRSGGLPSCRTYQT
jgi:hypothetical protein